MLKYTIKVDGMMCGMCEAHVNDAIRKAFSVKKVTSSHSKGETVLIMEEALDEDALGKIIAGLGYTMREIKKEPYQKKKLFGKW